MNRERLLAAGLPVVAIVAIVTVVIVVSLSSAAFGTLGFDFLSYDIAVRRFLAGGPLYDQGYTSTGGFGLFYYPPPFVLLALPMALLDPNIAVWAWTVLLVGIFALGVGILPVPVRLRWLVLLLGGISWPLVYAIKLGQVGPILFLAFAAGWRWMEAPWRLGTAAAIGTAVKLQPALLFAWALLTGRRRAVAAGLAVLAVLAIAATLVAGPDSWVQQATLLARVSRPIDTARNMTPGHVAYEAGLGYGVAWAIQIANWVGLAVVVLVATFRCRPVASYMAVVIATQLASPILWDHYALILLLPVAWLLSLGRRWAVVIPLATSIAFVGGIPPLVYPVAFWATLLWVVREGWGGSSGRLPAQASPEAGAILAP